MDISLINQFASFIQQLPGVPGEWKVASAIYRRKLVQSTLRIVNVVLHVGVRAANPRRSDGIGADQRKLYRVANPIFATIELGSSVVTSVLAVIAPVAAIVCLALILLIIVTKLLPKFRKRTAQVHPD